MICPECGKMLPDDAGFCVRCGENQHNPNAEVYKKTKSSEEKSEAESREDNEKNAREKTRILNIIPDEISLSKKSDDVSEDAKEKSDSDKNKSEENPAPKRRRKPVPPPENDENEENSDNSEDEEEVVTSSPKFAVISVVLAMIICLGIVIYFFTNNSIRNRETQQQITETSETSETTVETTTVTTVETTETEPPVETSVMTDAENNSYTIELADSIPAKVVLDEGTLRVRSYPSTDSSILGQLANGQEVTVNGICGEWYYISYDEKSGFVFSEYILIEQADAAETTVNEDESIPEDNQNIETEENSPAEDNQQIAE
ncbi:MAG: SH3 domain-containing protein [Oscillospiraceae bacterium]